MIRLESVHKSFGNQVVLNGVSAEIDRGERTCIVGKSGVGKSVLMKIMLGLLDADEGSVVIEGKEGRSAIDGLMQRAGVVFQGAALFDSMSVFENVGLRFLEEGTANKTDLTDKVKVALENVGLEETAMNKFPGELSGGMQKRVAIARAIIHEPEYLFWDEPTTGLDPVSSGIIDDLIEALSNHPGRTTVIVTHDLTLIRKLADKVMMIHEGRLHFMGEKEVFFGGGDLVIEQFLEREAFIQ